MTRNQITLLRNGSLLLAAGILAACGGRSDRAPIERRTAANTPEVQTGSGGIRNYGDYQTVVANGGETISSIANRIGLSSAELGAYNGRSPTDQLAAGEELVLPPRPGGYGVASSPQSPQTQDTSTENSVEPSIIAAPIGGEDPALSGAPAPAEDPAAPGTDGWSPELAAAAIARATGINDDGTLAAPPSANEPLPDNPTTPGTLQSPDLQQYQTGQSLSPDPDPAPAAVDSPASPELAATTPVPTGETGAEATPEPAPAIDARSATALQRPVQGPIAVGYRRGGGSSRNDGVDFAASAGSPVVAADDGEVALVSESLGGLGTIVLLRHGGDLLTVYGRIDGVTLRKGALVRRGEQIGVVAQPPSGSEGRMHFEVRRGAESLDPTRFLSG
ncbi:MAG: peptidoglycan DD-metalloendopeptidase family protein [Pseudomonadota bacterium]